MHLGNCLILTNIFNGHMSKLGSLFVIQVNVSMCNYEESNILL